MQKINLQEIINQAEKENWKELNLDGKQIKLLPPEVGSLINLRKLSLGSNKLTHIPPEIGNLINLQSLVLRDNYLIKLPPEVGKLSNLTLLSLWGNRLTDLPPEIGDLSSLQELFLWNNKLTTLPAEIGKLSSLRLLNIWGNDIVSLPPEIGNLKLNDFLFYLNPIKSPPEEILKLGKQAVLEYLKKLDNPYRRYEARVLLLGQGGVGKTSIVRSLQGKEFIANLESTEGVDVKTGSFTVPHFELKNIDIKINSWDFAGQVIEQSTHQFFMSTETIYILVWNSRYGCEQGKIDYWLDLINSRSPNSPIILVATHIDIKPPDINFHYYTEKFPQVKNNIYVSNKSKKGINSLFKAISKEASALPKMGILWPTIWGNIENELKMVSGNDNSDIDSKNANHHISFEEFRAICLKHGLTQKKSINFLSKSLHNLGHILHFQNSDLKELIILQPNWITKAISYVLNDEEVLSSKGILYYERIPIIWKDYEDSLHPLFLALMDKFDLIFPISQNDNIPFSSCLIPLLLPYAPPEYNYLDSDKQLKIIFWLPFIPEGIFAKFIVKTQRFALSPCNHWRNGVRLSRDDQYAEITLNKHDKEITINVFGSNPAYFYGILIDTFENIFSFYPGLIEKILRKVPCPNFDNPEKCIGYFNYDNVLRAERMNVETLQCDVCFKHVSTHKLLYGIHKKHDLLLIKEVNEKAKTILESCNHISCHISELSSIIIDICQGQRELLLNLNRLLTHPDCRCPYIFTLEPYKKNFFKRDLLTESFMLHLWCQYDGGWHPVIMDDPYEIENPYEWLKALRPLGKTIFPYLKLAIPLIKAAVGLDISPNDSTKALSAQLEFMSKILDIPQTITGQDDTTYNLPHSDQNIIKLDGSSLREFYYLLSKLDKSHKWAGLREIKTETGEWLWVCEKHYQEMKRPDYSNIYKIFKVAQQG